MICKGCFVVVPCIEKDYGDLQGVYVWLWKTAGKKLGILNIYSIVTFTLIFVCNHLISLQLMFVRRQSFVLLSTDGTVGAK